MVCWHAVLPGVLNSRIHRGCPRLIPSLTAASPGAPCSTRQQVSNPVFRRPPSPLLSPPPGSDSFVFVTYYFFCLFFLGLSFGEGGLVTPLPSPQTQTHRWHPRLLRARALLLSCNELCPSVRLAWKVKRFRRTAVIDSANSWNEQAPSSLAKHGWKSPRRGGPKACLRPRIPSSG